MNTERKHIRLSELNEEIRNCIQDRFVENYWIVAEIGEIKFNRNGHAYLELIEKEANSDKIIAKASANIWSYTLRMLRPYFETSTGKELEVGIKILVSVSVEFHPVYGFSLNIKDIDPAYTLGEIELRRLEIIRQLTEDGVISMNQELELPLVIQKVAVISSETAAGYQDFMNQLAHNPYGYNFYCKLFPSVMQGYQTESSIINSLEAIYNYESFFDAVVIIRGGGSRSDLMSFDNYKLAYTITQFPLPVISGIGHEKDTSIVDMVSHTSLKTPTAVAEFLISHMAGFENRLDGNFQFIEQYCSDYFDNQYETVESFSRILVPLVQKKLHFESRRIDLNAQKMNFLAQSAIENEHHQLKIFQIELKRLAKSFTRFKSHEIDNYIAKLKSELIGFFNREKKNLLYFENSLEHFRPENVLKKGYSITKRNGKVLLDSEQLAVGQEIETILYKGKLTSIISDKSKN